MRDNPFFFGNRLCRCMYVQYVCMHVCIVCMYVCMYVCVCVCVCVYEKVINMCIHACMYVCACMHACMHACICMHACTRSISDTKPAIPAISPLLLQAKRERVVYWYSFSNHHRMCSHTIECVLLLESVVYWYSFSNPRTTSKCIYYGKTTNLHFQVHLYYFGQELYHTSPHQLPSCPTHRGY